MRVERSESLSSLHESSRLLDRDRARELQALQHVRRREAPVRTPPAKPWIPEQWMLVLTPWGFTLLLTLLLGCVVLGVVAVYDLRGRLGGQPSAPDARTASLHPRAVVRQRRVMMITDAKANNTGNQTASPSVHGRYWHLANGSDAASDGGSRGNYWDIDEPGLDEPSPGIHAGEEPPMLVPLPMPTLAPPKPAGTPPSPAGGSTASEGELVCYDTPNWKNKDGCGCDCYEENNFCRGGEILQRWTGGQVYDYPETKCVVCGKRCIQQREATEFAWKVVTDISVSIRENKSTLSSLLGTKSRCSIIAGVQEDSWIKLSHAKGYVAIEIPGKTLLEKVKVTFAKISGGRCSDVGKYPVVDAAMCATAASALGLQYSKLQLAKAEHKPEGCYWLQDESALWLSVNPSNWGQPSVGPRELICSDQPSCYASRLCLAHTAFGDEYMSLSNAFTLPNKRRYATLHGYALVNVMRNDLDSIMEKDFQDCFPGMTPWGLDLNTVLKVCSVFKAFHAGCNVVLWTDADAGIMAHHYPLEHFMQSNHGAHVYWSVSDVGAQDMCQGYPNAGCINMEMFLSCLNSGAFIIKNTFWSQSFLLRILGRSRDLENPFCTTAHFNNVGFDQCFLQGHKYGDQCAIACETRADRSLMAKMECLGNHVSPVFQQMYGMAGWIPTLRWDTFVANCITKPKYECARAMSRLPGFYG